MKKPYCDYCGDCCRGLGDEFGIEIRPADAERIAAFLGLAPATFLAQYTYVEYTEDNEVVHYLFDTQSACIFLKNNRCSIQDVKPMQCYLGWPDKAFLGRQINPRDYPCIPDGDDVAEIIYAY